MRGHINTAVALRAGQAKHVVIFVDCSANCAKAVVTVGQHIGNRKPLQTGCPRCLNDADIGNIVACQLVEFDLQFVHAAGRIVRFQDAVADRRLRRVLLRHLGPSLCRKLRFGFGTVLHDLRPVHQIYTLVI